jgi:5'-3' exonuclease
MKALIDGDIVVYRCAASAEGEDDVGIALVRVDRLMEEILYATKADSYRAFLSGGNNFRYDVFPQYKANRKDAPKPRWLGACQDYLLSNWNAEITDGCEADDALGCAQDGTGTIICSIDKDLLQIPGKHYNFVKNEFSEVTEFQGIKHFYLQLLQGDRTDGISGLDGIGPKKAEKYLEGCETEEDLFNTVRGLYNNDKLLDTFGKCLWIWRHEGNIWDKISIGDNQYKHAQEQVSGSTIQPLGEINQSMEHTTQEMFGYQQAGPLKVCTDPMESPPPLT